MKKSKQILYISLSLFMAAFLSGSLQAQNIELNGFTGWHFGGKIKFYEGEFKINDAQNYGGKLAYGVSETTFVEASYLRSDTEGRWRPYSSLLPSETIEMSSNYIHIAGLQQLNYGRLSPYATLGLGIAWFAPKNTSEYRTSTQLSATFGAGVKIFITDVIGIRLQGSMLMPMVFQGIGFGFGTGGVSAGAYTRITPFQGEFSGGLVIRIPSN